MNKRENYLSVVKRKGYEKVPTGFGMCPSLSEKFHDYLKNNNVELDFDPCHRVVPGLQVKNYDPDIYRKYYGFELKEGVNIDAWGIAHEPGSSSAMHMTKMRYPMMNFTSVEQILAYPFPQFEESSIEIIKEKTMEAHNDGYATLAYLHCTIWENSWYLRSMEELMADMMSDDPMADAVLDNVTRISILRAEAYAKAGVDAIFLGDDIGMQKTIMMSVDFYCDWLKPRIKKVIDAARRINPDVLIFYHSCGFVTPFIPHLIEIGVDVLDPVQPECMDFKEIHDAFGDRLSFYGTIGTQTTMPFGTPDQVRREVFRNLEIAGDKGGLLVAPTHLLEPEVPVENVLAYVKACNDFK
ncbi:MAG: uroporphyrinogen decarboxylase family protein [Saccharofermentanales bacterium]